MTSLIEHYIPAPLSILFDSDTSGAAAQSQSASPRATRDASWTPDMGASWTPDMGFRQACVKAQLCRGVVPSYHSEILDMLEDGEDWETLDLVVW
jgi:hypothetical protein